VTMAFDWRCEN